MRDDPSPPVHTWETLRLPPLILGAFGIEGDALDDHGWTVHIRLVEHEGNRLSRLIEIEYQGDIVDSSRSRSWREDR